jgi:hypothetical protein
VAGDVSLCAYCATPAIFTDAGTLRKPTAEEQGELDTSADVQRAIAGLKRHLN